MDAVGIAAGRRNQVEDEQVNVLTQQLHRLVDELAEDGVWLDLFPGETISTMATSRSSADVANGHDILLATIELQVGLTGEVSFRSGQDDAACSDSTRCPIGSPFPRSSSLGYTGLQRQHIGPEMRRVLLGHRVMIRGKHAAVEQSA